MTEQEVLRGLLAALRRLSECHAALLEVKQQERDAVLAVDLAALEQANRRQDRLHIDVRIAERERARLASQLARHWQLDEATLTLRAICERLPAAEAAPLRQAGETLADQAARLREHNDANAVLIAQSLRFVQDALTALTGTATGGDCYTPRGLAGPSAGAPLLVDRRV